VDRSKIGDRMLDGSISCKVWGGFGGMARGRR
jgi:hypothetical protein